MADIANSFTGLTRIVDRGTKLAMVRVSGVKHDIVSLCNQIHVYRRLVRMNNANLRKHFLQLFSNTWGGGMSSSKTSLSPSAKSTAVGATMFSEGGMFITAFLYAARCEMSVANTISATRNSS
jgi:hypothetical protein